MKNLGLSPRSANASSGPESGTGPMAGAEAEARETKVQRGCQRSFRGYGGKFMLICHLELMSWIQLESLL